MRHALAALTASALSITSSIALAQVAPAPGAAGVPAGSTGAGSMNWLWVVIVAAVLAAAVWYFGKRKGDTTRL